MGFLFLLLAAILLVVGAELFASNVAGVGRMLGVSGLAVGLLLAGAEPEELVTALTAAVRNQPGIAAGDAIGSNVTMLTLVLGLVSLVRPAPTPLRVRRYAMGAALLGTFAAAVASTDTVITRYEGLALVGLFPLAVLTVWRLEHRIPPIGEVDEALEDREDIEAVGPGRALIVSLAGLAIMAGGGWLAVVGAEQVVPLLGLTGSTVGLTLVAIATTAEMLALVSVAARHRVEEVAIAGIIGAVGYNATVTLGAAALVAPLDTTGVLPAAWFAAMLPLIVVLLGIGDRIGRFAGMLLVIAYLGFLWLQLA